MKKIVILFYTFISITILGQNSLKQTSSDTEIKIDFKKFEAQFYKKKETSQKMKGNISILLPENGLVKFILNENDLIPDRIASIITFNGKSEDGKFSMKLSLYNNRLSAIIKTYQGKYYVLERSGISSSDHYRIYSLSEAMKKEAFICGANVEDFLSKTHDGFTTSKSVTNFPIGSQLRKYRMAVAATGESVESLGSADAVLNEIISKINAVNLIYESEVSVTFTLISETLNKSILFTNSATDPFTGTGGSAGQAGFVIMNNSGLLTYNKYDIGHTVNISTSGGASGTAGGQPCNDSSKALGWSNWGAQNSLGFVTNLIAHEMGHQFGASHSYNATGGDSPGDTFCANSWSSSGAVEPGSGATLMAYGTNCSYPVDQRYPSDNYESYFHARSLDQILNRIQTLSTCYTVVASSNIPPAANAGADITIPKNTPFRLLGTGTDANDANLSYTWEENDAATANDKGAFGSTLNGAGGYTAVNSATAPLFRSVKSNINGERYFPKLNFILNNQNVPPMNEGEALPNVARNINLRLTVRDNNASNGGIDSDDLNVTVADCGPLSVSYPNASGITLNANSSATITWNVNNTNSIANTVHLFLSIDGGFSFPYILASNISNNGSYVVTIPNIPATTKARIKVSALLNPNAEFFDISDNNFTIASACEAFRSYISPTFAVTTYAGSAVANLNMTGAAAASEPFSTKSIIFNAPSTNSAIHGYSSADNVTPISFNDNYPTHLVQFRVTQTGNYTISKNSGFLITSVYTATPPNLSGFLTSNSTGAYYGVVNASGSTRSVVLNEGTNYFMYLCNFSNPANANTYTLTFNGPGMVYETINTPLGYNYTYIAVNNSTNKVEAFHPTADFTILPIGSYTVKGLSYINTASPSSFIGKTFNEIVAMGACVQESSNKRQLTITGVLSTADIKKTESDVKVAPNPVNDWLTVVSNKNVSEYEILDLSGRIIIQKSKFHNSIFLKNLSTGSYILKLFDGHHIIYKTTIIKN
ncbi:reprolysin-like metallopeptidase [Chryseobacterium sp.]|uniref:reprolysin-like metallopeptidase n=1 Tax=Chryseobacterium sp. TaxID=1871047 RepID=UPI0035C74B6A